MLLNLILAGITLVSGTWTQSASTSAGHVSPTGGAIIGARVTVIKTIPVAPAATALRTVHTTPAQGNQGTQTLLRCHVSNFVVPTVTTIDPHGCAYAFPFGFWF